MTETELDELIDTWIEHNESETAHTSSPTWWAAERVSNWRYDGDHESLWSFILAAYQREISESTIAILAAGALEDLLADKGSEYIGKIEILARRDPRFNHLLGGVWKNSMSDDVWQRVEAARLKVW
jgi:hypothetical protein